MLLHNKINSLHSWGTNILTSLHNGSYENLITRAVHANLWFTKEDVHKAVEAIAIEFLNREKLESWLSAYSENNKPVERKTIAIIMAGNIPLVGFHDLLCVWASGNKALVKLSSKDEILLPAFLEELYEIDPSFQEITAIVPDFRQSTFDAVIATGSDNSSRYFDYYFGKYPHVIRKNRNSVAVLTGNEKPEEIKLLGEDIFTYLGLGCRNVSKVFLPNGFEIGRFFEPLETYSEVFSHNKYNNNYSYHKSLMLINKIPHFDNGFLLLKEDEGMATPVSMLHYSYYDDMEEVKKELEEKKDKIQVVVSSEKITEFTLGFGESQKPGLTDYADRVDTLQFLLEL